MDDVTNLEIERPRSPSELISVTFEVYRRFPILFLVLAAMVVVPYQLIVLALTGNGPSTSGKISVGLSLTLTATALFVVGPLVSALHVHAVRDISEGRKPDLRSVARRGLITLPVVSAAVIISWLGTVAGFIALIVPGILLTLRWSVVAQAAALEGGGWTDALRRSKELTRGHYWHIIGVLLLAAVVTGIPGFLVGLVFRHSNTTPANFVAATAWQVVARSFAALAAAMLFFDLSARLRAKEEPSEPDLPPALVGAISGRTVEPTGHPLDPASYSDEDRPAGWYVIPDRPWRMSYWAADGKQGWSNKTAKTPKETLASWRDLRWRR
jgi:ABC-type multidrug transport system fused ATPase/permease subunit